MPDTTNNYLPRKTFFWVTGILVGLLIPVLGYVVGKQDRLSETFNHSITEIKIDVAELRIGQEFILEYIREQ